MNRNNSQKTPPSNARRQLLLFLLILPLMVSGQSQPTLNGYVSEMPSYLYSWPSKTDVADNLLHNRLNLAWSPSEKITAAVEIRNRWMWGGTLSALPNHQYNNLVVYDAGYINLSHTWFSGSNYLLNTTIDRMWLEYIKDNFQIRAGRQRINWSQSMVWNPNDIFNAYNYFDFDYAEKPGIDGLRFQYYTGSSSLLETVVKVNRQGKVSIAGLYRFNQLGYDFQFIGGVVDQENYLLGAGWSGHIAGAGFYGEVTTVFPEKGANATEFISSIGANYTLPNSLMFQAEALYSSNLNKGGEGKFSDLYYGEASFRNLSITEFTGFLSVSFPLTPLLNTTLSSMIFPEINSYYLGSSIEYSLSDNLYLSGIFQFFTGEEETSGTKRSASSLISYARLKWNF